MYLILMLANGESMGSFYTDGCIIDGRIVRIHADGELIWTFDASEVLCCGYSWSCAAENPIVSHHQ